MPLESFGVPVDGPDEMLRMVRLCLREGVDTIKLNISGDFGTDSAPADAAVMTDGEIAVAVEATHVIGRRVAAHARASDSVKRAVRHGVDVIYHCDFADEEALDMLEAAKDRVFTGPAGLQRRHDRPDESPESIGCHSERPCRAPFYATVASRSPSSVHDPLTHVSPLLGAR